MGFPLKQNFAMEKESVIIRAGWIGIFAIL
jgi:hypothetical protein